MKRIVYTSLAIGLPQDSEDERGRGSESGSGDGSVTESVAVVMQSHLETERYLKACGVAYTIVREGTYNEIWPMYLGVLDMGVLKGGEEETGELVLTVPIGDGGIAWAAQDDLGAGTAKILASVRVVVVSLPLSKPTHRTYPANDNPRQASDYTNRTVTLTGTHPTTLTSLARTVSTILHRRVTLQFAPEDAFVQFMIQTGKLPEETIRGAVTTFQALVRGELARADPLLSELLGREPKRVEETVEEVLTGKVGYKQTRL